MCGRAMRALFHSNYADYLYKLISVKKNATTKKSLWDAERHNNTNVRTRRNHDHWRRYNNNNTVEREKAARRSPSRNFVVIKTQSECSACSSVIPVGFTQISTPAAIRNQNCYITILFIRHSEWKNLRQIFKNGPFFFSKYRFRKNGSACFCSPYSFPFTTVRNQKLNFQLISALKKNISISILCTCSPQFFFLKDKIDANYFLKCKFASVCTSKENTNIKISKNVKRLSKHWRFKLYHSNDNSFRPLP